MSQLLVFNIQRFCLHDGPGIRTAVFLKGCPLRCEWCHNPESHTFFPELLYYREKCSGCGRCLPFCKARIRSSDLDGKLLFYPERCTLCGMCVSLCPNHANIVCGRWCSVEELMLEVKKDLIFYGEKGGLTISGGEPAFQAEGAEALTKAAKRQGISVVIETCGYGETEFFLQEAKLGAMFYFDIKTLHPEKHELLTGVPQKEILHNLNELMEAGAHIVLRLPMIPGINDSDEELALLADFLKENRKRFSHAEIMPYHNLGSGKAAALHRSYHAPAESASQEQREGWIKKLKDYGVRDVIFS